MNLNNFYQMSPIALKENLLYWNNYRITILTDRLFRIEQSIKRQFCDLASQTVFYRDLPIVSFSKTEFSDSIEIKTNKVTLAVKEDFYSSYVLIDDKKVFLDNKGNLMGTARTLDNFDGIDNLVTKEKLKLCYGVCSRSGVAFLDDSKTLVFKGNKLFNRTGESLDGYVFAYGFDYKEALKDFYKISGKTPLICRYALGNWWSRYYSYTDKSYLTLLDKFRRCNVPLTVATIDMDWHYSNNLISDLGLDKEKIDKEINLSGWTGYSWNKRLFPDYRKFLKEIKDRNLRITLNLHPADGIRFFEDCYPKVCSSLHLDSKEHKTVQFDFTNPRFVHSYFKDILNPYEKDGVDFWWIDWQQGTQTKIENLDPLYLLNHYHYANISRNKPGIILSRFSGIGSHRYPLGFSGDTYQTWKTLDFLPYFTITSSNCGYTWWSHDIGGHQCGNKDSELYLRFLQFGVFSPINRLHCMAHEMASKEPWLFSNGVGLIAEEWLRLRHRMIPLLYTAAYETHQNFIALIEPLYYYYPKVEQAYQYKNEYFFAQQMLVCPITKPAKGVYGEVETWIPEGKWTDYFTGFSYFGPTKKVLYRSLDYMPVLVKEGSIIVTSNEINTNSCNNLEKLKVELFAGMGNYTLYEDKNGKVCFTHFELFKTSSGVQLIITIEGDKKVIPSKREYEITLRNIKEAIVITDLEYKKLYKDEFTISIKAIDKIDLVFNYPEKSSLDLKKEMISNILARVDENNLKRIFFYDDLMKMNSLREIKKIIDNSTFSDSIKKAFYEVL